MSEDGALFRWEYTSKRLEEEADREERWRIVKKDFFLQNDAKLKCASFHAKSNLLVVGFSNGIFGLYELPDSNNIHTLR